MLTETKPLDWKFVWNNSQHYRRVHLNHAVWITLDWLNSIVEHLIEDWMGEPITLVGEDYDDGVEVRAHPDGKVEIYRQYLALSPDQTHYRCTIERHDTTVNEFCRDYLRYQAWNKLKIKDE